MEESDRHGTATGVARALQRLVEHGRDREAVELATRELTTANDRIPDVRTTEGARVVPREGCR